MQTILATTSSFGNAWTGAEEHLRGRGYSLAVNPHGRKLTEAELDELLQKHEPVGLLAGTEPVTGAVLRRASGHLKAVSRVGVGWDNVDHAVAAELGIPVLRTVGVLDQAVAELALGFMLDALRHVSRQDRELRGGTWTKRMGGLLAAKTVGIVGYGAIGRRVGELCRAFGAEVVYTDVQEAKDSPDRACSLEELLDRGHVVTLHASGSQCLLGAAELDRCRPGAILVNTARGGMVDEAALAERLADGRIGCACLDVYEDEPYHGPLTGLDNTVLTPHVASFAAETRLEMERKAVENLLSLLEPEA